MNRFGLLFALIIALLTTSISTVSAETRSDTKPTLYFQYVNLNTGGGDFLPGYFDRDGKLIVSADEQRFGYGYPFSEGYAQVCMKQFSECGFIDSQGNVVLDMNYHIRGEGLHDGLILVDTSDSPRYFEWKPKDQAFMNVKGEVVFKAPYLYVGDFSEGYAVIGDKLSNGTMRYGMIDTSGKIAIEKKYTKLHPISEGLALAQESKSKPYGYLDSQGNWAIKPQFKYAGDFHDGLAWVGVETKNAKTKETEILYGYIDKKGKWVIKPTYTIAGDFHDGLANVYLFDKTEKNYYVDKKGKIVIDLQKLGVSGAYDFSDGYAVVEMAQGKKQTLRKFNYIDKKGKFLLKTPVNEAEPFNNGIARIQSEGTSETLFAKHVFINTKGKTIYQVKHQKKG